jgi:hypothetical protein
MSGKRPDPQLAGVPTSVLLAEVRRRVCTDPKIVAEVANQRVRRLLAEGSQSA